MLFSYTVVMSIKCPVQHRLIANSECRYTKATGKICSSFQKTPSYCTFNLIAVGSICPIVKI